MANNTACIDKNEFAACIKAFDFRALFIEGLGWNSDKGTQPVEASDKTYTVQNIAEKSGFRILLCNPPAGDVIPPLSIRKQIENKISKLFHEHILIFVDSNKAEQRWMSTIRLVDKKPMEIAWHKHQNPELLYQRVSSLGFEMSQEGSITIVDVTKLVAVNFSQNNEKVTKKFYERFKQEHTAFLSFITGIDDVVKREWYASLMLNRLMFCYFIQKRGFLDNGDLHYLKNRLKTCKENKGKNKFYSFYRNFLLVLFHQGLGSPCHSGELIKEIGKIPYLNGGLFDVHHIEKIYDGIIIPDEAFERIFDFFEKFQWHLDTRIDRDGDNINPDVIGYIFEKYINDRAQMGAYYTKEDITQYISTNTIIPWLLEKVKSLLPEVFSEGGGFWQYVQDSGDRYIYCSVKHGAAGKNSIAEIDIPLHIKDGIDTAAPHLLERRKDWNTAAPHEFGLPTEIWRETIARWERYFEIKHKIEHGAIHEINDLITYNLDIRELVKDYLAQTSYYNFVYQFYFNALKKVTVLDPTCGSGAFLFAAMNILEPLYETCIARMEDFLRGGVKNDGFLNEIDGINKPAHPNRQYYIFKHIILHNLYGVDIMNEAVEIAKLRLFLKLVSQVDPNPNVPNYGIEPLPDIDFNIRCGNTLVGFATKQQLFDTIAEYEGMHCEGKMDELEKSCADVAGTYAAYQKHQIYSAAIKHSDIKIELEKQIAALGHALDQYLARTYGINPDATKTKNGKKEFAAWKKSHQPFHWFAEFYKIIEKNGGFDVVIGNPPYVEMRQIKYRPKGLDTLESAAVHAMCIERAYQLINGDGNISLIVPLSLISTQRMIAAQKIIEKGKAVWYANFAWRPGKLFENVNRALTIFISNGSKKEMCNNSSYIKWYSENRGTIFSLLTFMPYNVNRDSFWSPKISIDCEISILNKILKKTTTLQDYIAVSKHNIYYKSTGVMYWRVFTAKPPKFFINSKMGASSREMSISVKTNDLPRKFVAIFSSSLYWWWGTVTSNMRDLNPSDLFGFKFDKNLIDSNDLVKLADVYIRDIEKNSVMMTRLQKTTGETQVQSFKISKSKPIIDEIDKVLAKHYGFTEEELDFIINYDIKYRMGSELEGEE